MSAGSAVGPTQTPVNQAMLEQKVKLQTRMRAGAGWMMAVALFSVVNSALMLTGAQLHFIVGLGVTQIADGVGKVGGAAGSVVGFVVTLIAAGIFLLFWKFAREGQKWAFIVGMTLYALDGLIFLGFGLWLDLAFHAFAIFNIYKGLAALNEMNRMDRQTAAITGQAITP
jgi:hypothetical protein